MNITDEIPDYIVEKAVSLAIKEYDEAIKYMIFGSEYKDEA